MWAQRAFSLCCSTSFARYMNCWRTEKVDKSQSYNISVLRRLFSMPGGECRQLTMVVWVSDDWLTSLGLACLLHPASYPLMLLALVRHLTRLQKGRPVTFKDGWAQFVGRGFRMFLKMWGIFVGSEQNVSSVPVIILCLLGNDRGVRLYSLIESRSSVEKKSIRVSPDFSIGNMSCNFKTETC